MLIPHCIPQMVHIATPVIVVAILPIGEGIESVTFSVTGAVGVVVVVAVIVVVFVGSI